MKGFFALVDTSVLDVQNELASTEFEVLTPPFDPKILKGTQVLLIVSVSAFLAVADHLLDWDGVVIIFDAPPKCEALVGITLLDVEKRDASFRYTFSRLQRGQILAKVKEALASKDDIVFHQRKSNLLPYLLGQTSNSQMDKLQTWKYRVPPTQRDELFSTVIKWFFASKPTVDNLRAKLLSILGATKSKPLDNLFEGNRFTELKAAIQQILQLKAATKSYSVDKIAATHGVSPFDIRYLMAANDRRKKVQTFEPPLEVATIQRAYRLEKPSPLEDTNETDDPTVEAG